MRGVVIGIIWCWYFVCMIGVFRFLIVFGKVWKLEVISWWFGKYFFNILKNCINFVGINFGFDKFLVKGIFVERYFNVGFEGYGLGCCFFVVVCFILKYFVIIGFNFCE